MARSWRAEAVDVVAEAMRTTRRRPLRTVLTGLGVTLGVAAFLAAVGISSSGATAVAREFDASRATEVSFTFERSAPATLATVVTLCSRLRLVDGTVAGGVFAENVLGPSSVPVARTAGGEPIASTPVHGATDGYLAAVQAVVTGGTAAFDPAADPSRQALVGRAVLDRSADGGVAVGDRLVVGGISFRVAGIVERAPRDPRLVTSVVVPLGIGLVGNRSDTVRLVGLARTELGASDEVADVLGGVLMPELEGRLDASPALDLDAIERRVVTQVDGVAIALGVTSLVVGGVGILNSMSVAVIERRGELGLRRCLGASRTGVAVLIAAEGALVGVVGALLGVGLGVAVVAVAAAVRSWPLVLPWPMVGGGFVAGVGVGLLGGVVPALRGTRVPPITALRR